MKKETGFFDTDEINGSADTNGSIGFLSINVPEELIIAAGRTPFRVCGSEKPAKLANAYLPKTFDPYVLDSLEGALDGTYSFLDGVIIANISDGHRRLYDAWRTGAPSASPGRRQIPPPLLSDVPCPGRRQPLSDQAHATDGRACRH